MAFPIHCFRQFCRKRAEKSICGGFFTYEDDDDDAKLDFCFKDTCFGMIWVMKEDSDLLGISNMVERLLEWHNFERGEIHPNGQCFGRQVSESKDENALIHQL